MSDTKIDTHLANYTLSSDLTNIITICKSLNIQEYLDLFLAKVDCGFTKDGRLDIILCEEMKQDSYIAESLKVVTHDIVFTLEAYEACLYSRTTVEESIAMVLIGLFRSNTLNDSAAVFNTIHEGVKKHKQINPTSLEIVQKYFKGKLFNKKLVKSFPYNIVADIEYVSTFSVEYNVERMWKLYNDFHSVFIQSTNVQDYNESLVFFNFNMKLNAWEFSSIWAKRKCFIKNTNARVREYIKKFREESEDFSESKTNVYTIKLR